MNHSAIGAHVLTHYADGKQMLNDGATFQHQYAAEQWLRKLVAKAFTPNPMLQGQFQPLRDEHELHDLPVVQGEIPRDISGAWPTRRRSLH